MNRALVVGSEIDGLRGVSSDTRRMSEMLTARGFLVELRTGEAATRAGILAGYDALIEASLPGDAAVVYYAGHGFYEFISRFAAPAGVAAWQCIAPTDVRRGDAQDWRGITAWELSIKQAQLTARTRNVTVILDCCAAAQMSRDAAALGAVPRALPSPDHLGFAAHLQALRETYPGAFDALDPRGNQEAVRLAACAQDESAYEWPDAQGVVRGAFTEALLELLQEVGDAQVSWAAIAEALRARVLRRFPRQRPELEGPVRRRLFSLVQDDDHGHVAVRTEGADGVDGAAAILLAGRLTGVTPGDVYGVMPVGASRYDASRALATVEVVEVAALTARVRTLQGDAPLPADAVAMPLTSQGRKRTVALEVPAGARATVEAALAATRTLRAATPDDDDAPVARLKLARDALTIEDAGGPLFPAARFPEELAGVVKHLANLGVAQALRELEGEHGVFTHELDLELGAVHGGRARALPDSGAALGLRDRIYIKVGTRARRRLFVHVFNVGVRGQVTLLTSFAPSGVALDGGDPAFVFGHDARGALVGQGLHWPRGLARDTFPRVDEYLVIVTTARVGLQCLETHDVLPPERSKGNRLQELLAGLHDGRVRARVGQVGDGFYLKRLSILLHPRDGAMTGPGFAIDEGHAGGAAASQPSAWLGPAGEPLARAPALGANGDVDGDADGAVAAPREISIRLAELIVEDPRALPSSDLRVDALICTRARRCGHATWTRTVASLRQPGQLVAEDELLFRGPVVDFVELTLLVSRAPARGPSLSELFAGRSRSPDFQDAAAALRISAEAGAAPWVTAVGASAVLSRIAVDLVHDAAGAVIGLYRTSFVAGARFGVGRHPRQGRHLAQGLSFALVIEAAEPTPDTAPARATSSPSRPPAPPSS